MGFTGTMDESDRLQCLQKYLIDTFEEPEATQSSKEKALDQCLDSMTPQMSTVKGSRGCWQSRSKELPGMVRSPLVQPPTLFMKLSAADSLWMD